MTKIIYLQTCSNSKQSTREKEEEETAKHVYALTIDTEIDYTHITFKKFLSL